MKTVKYGLACILFAVSTHSALAFDAPAQERFDHFKGEQSTSLEEALANFAEYNEKLEVVLNGELEPADMAEIHQLTYTLENALERINIELAQLAETLEEVHLGSEQLAYDRVREAARLYLETARKIEK